MNDLSPLRQLAPASQAISPAKFAHFVLRTGQVEKMAEWYRTVLAARGGLEPLPASDAWRSPPIGDPWPGPTKQQPSPSSRRNSVC